MTKKYIKGGSREVNAIGVELGGQKCFPARENLCLNEDSRFKGDLVDQPSQDIKFFLLKNVNASSSVELLSYR